MPVIKRVEGSSYSLVHSPEVVEVLLPKEGLLDPGAIGHELGHLWWGRQVISEGLPWNWGIAYELEPTLWAASRRGYFVQSERDMIRYLYEESGLSLEDFIKQLNRSWRRVQRAVKGARPKISR